MYQNCYSNPYMGSFPTAPMMPQAQAPSYQKPVISGRIVDRIEDVTPNDVPMDGTSSIFPLKDDSAIFVKRWSSDGTINTVKYIPVHESKETDYISKHGDQILAKLKELSDQVRKLNVPVRNQQYQVKKPKREEGDEE